jgi:hypothetical protein
MRIPLNVNKAAKKPHKLWLAVLVMLGLAAWLIVHWPHGGLWYDEALTTYVATDSWATLWHWCTQVDIQVPFHYVALRLWTAALGDGEFALRLLSALGVLLAAAGMIAAGQRLAGFHRDGRRDGRAGLGYVAAILLGTMPGLLWIGYEVRAYALALALYAWATAFLVKIIDDSQRAKPGFKLLIGYALLMLATLYTHYTALGAFAAHIVIIGIVALVRRSRSLVRALAVILILVGLGFAPWLPVLLARSAADRSYYSGTPISPPHAVAAILGFKLLARDDAAALPTTALPLVAGYSLLMVLGALLGWRTKRWLAALAGLMMTIWPVAIVAGLVYFKPKLAGRYAWPAWIGFDLLAGLFVMTLARYRRALVVIALIIIATAPWLIGERGHPPDSDFKGAFAYLCTHGDPADVIALRDGTLFVAARYYGRRPPCLTERRTVDLPQALITDVDTALTLPETQATMADIAAWQPPSVWVVSWQGDVMDPQGLAYALLDGAGEHTVVARMFGDVRLDRYERPRPVTGDPLALGQPMNVTPVPGGPTLKALRLLAPDVARPGDVLVLQAWWQRGASLQPDLRASARITTLDGGWTYAQVDQPPAGWKYVDDRWQPGIPALGRYELAVGPDVPPGKVAVRYVLYDAAGRWPPQMLNVGQVVIGSKP